MTPKKHLLAQMCIFFGIALISYCLAILLDLTSSTFEHRWRRIVNAEIQKDLCLRIDKDLEAFASSPLSFRRTSPQTIENETKTFLRASLKAERVPETFPIEYTGSQGRYAKCSGKLSKWLEIPSTERYARAEEIEYVTNEKSVYRGKESAGAADYAFEAKRVALVVGNANYDNQPLRNPVNDADDMARALNEMGFRVILLKDGTTDKIKNAFDQFIGLLLEGDIGFVYLAGHGLEYQGRNYFLPVNTRFRDPDEIPRVAFDVSQMIERVGRSGDKLTIFVIDACRSNPTLGGERSFAQGLARMPPAVGALIGFSTSPGTVAEDGAGRNSPYTKYLIKNLQRKGLRIEDVFKQTARDVEVETAGRQIPWYSSSLRVNISLH
jgi:hypothetical protein